VSPTFRVARFVSRWLAEPFLFVGVPALVYVAVMTGTASFIDFDTFREASLDVLAGRSPYPPPDASVLASEANFVYPPLAAYLFAPFAVLPQTLGTALFVVLVVAAGPLTLLLLGVRDWRCLCLSVVAAPIVNAASVGALSSLLAVALAAAWRLRARLLPAAIVVGVIVVSKLFLWPLLVWLAATRRTTTAIAAAAVAAVAVFGSWAAIGFAGLADYGKTLGLLSQVVQEKGYSPLALAMSVGFSEESARGLAMVLGALLLVLTVVVARKEDGERRALALALAAALALSPIVWTHYFALLFVPLALARPRLSPVWLLPVALWVAPGQSLGNTWLIVASLALAGLIVGVSAWPRRGPVASTVAAPAAQV
jgi:alpha-1,2-mannosyltransferase